MPQMGHLAVARDRFPPGSHTARMTDWPTIAISAASGLIGAVIGAWGALRAGAKSAEEARVLAREARLADEADRKAELARSSARNARTIVADALNRMYNVMDVVRKQQAGGIDAEPARQIIEAAIAAHATVLDVLRRDAYLLPEQVQPRLNTLYELMGVATFGILMDDAASTDVRTYGRYLELSLEAVVHGKAIPAHAEPPNLDDIHRPRWIPNPVPSGWAHTEAP